MKLTVPYFMSLVNQLSRSAFRTKPVYFPVSRTVSSDLCAVVQKTEKLNISSSNNFYWNPHRSFSTAPLLHADAEMVDVTFITSDGTKLKTKGKVGDNLLDVVVNNNVDLDGFGACEGTLACSTCHLVFKQEDFDKIKDKITDEELDMLDLAYGLCDTSRLGCQVTLTKELAGVEVEVPAGVNDARS